MQRNSSLEDELDTIEIDDLTYEYRENTNQLIKLTDDSTPTNNGGFVDGANLAIEYEYDDFGNMTKDHNKGITEIVYNHLNLPTKITFANSGQIEYVYNALGIKTEKIVTQGSTETITKYMAGGYQYENNVLKFFPHAEGYVIKEGTSTYKHVFNYTDHLGNIRLKYCDLNQNGTIESNEILEENHYYPFGMKHERYNEDSSALANKYKYNGKEWQDELGLNFYDYHARNYDPALGRWMNIDPLAENSRRWTPYNYAYNNSIYFIDPDGMQAGAAKGLNYNWKTGRLSYGTDIDNAGHEIDGNGEENDYEVERDDNVRINTKNKTVEVERTGDGHDRIFVDEEEVMATERGLLGSFLRENGYSISMIGPQGVGMGLTDLVLDVFNIGSGITLIKMGTTKILKSSVGFKVGFGASKETLVSSAYFTKLLGFKNLPVSRLPTLYGPAKDWGTFLGRNSPIFGGFQTAGGGYGLFDSVSN
ncbi:RHS repeat-associated core domain-containing protein [Flavobacterium azooxidireducens]|uniref:RHS repeat-associated core domain-containing protein n=1 Tax=Flavobacterium azooxidireducens TaxID=1871076 RepID=A0ABY4KIH2_9FLAO|nr:RHS repeat-associated core domain-containing protein [Flavobacterium azooxidireducens]UPQ80464.1 RHS repeat-associated core domain-containing protein [Flavobacterium azooxidireducens]